MTGESTIERFPLYLRALDRLLSAGVATVSSSTLSRVTGVQPALLRRDLSQLGALGTRGVGYEVEALHHSLAQELNGSKVWRVVIIGAGRFGQALAVHSTLRPSGFEVVAIVDVNPDLIGTVVAGVRITSQAAFEATMASQRPDLAVVATPGGVAQQVTDMAVGCGITSVLNLAPASLEVPPDVTVRNVDIARELQILTYHAGHRDVEPADRAVLAGAGELGV